MIVAKFGGSSLSDAIQFQKVKDILANDDNRRFVVVSAPGKRFPKDEKVTDLLLQIHQAAQLDRPFAALFDMVASRFHQIKNDLDIPCDLDGELNLIKKEISHHASRDYIASRGEYLCAFLMSNWLNLPMVDARDVIRFHQNGKLDEKQTYALLKQELLGLQRAIIPGFYGADEEGQIHVFSRGGSDITGALVAAGLDADLYENWTDVTGFRSADPHIVPDATYISSLTYRELRELSYMGATVLHEEAVFPVRLAGVPTSIRNTNDPLHPGTTIQYSTQHLCRVPGVTGIAGKKGFSVVLLEKDRMNDEVGFGRKVLAVFERHGINFEHLPTGIDALCVMVSSHAFQKRREQILKEIEDTVHPDVLSVQDGLALVATVGANMFRQHGVIARLFTAVSEQGIQIRTMFQAPSELSVIIGVNEEDLPLAVRAIYDAFKRD